MKKFIFALAILLLTASFAPNFTATAQVRTPDTVYLRDGRTIRGTLLGFVNGRFVVRVDQRYTTMPSDTTDPNVRDRVNEGEIQYFRPNEVDRIEIGGRSTDEARTETRTVQVTLDPNWIDSGVELRRGERVQISASGVITVGRTRITPDGMQRTDPTAPLPNAKEGELIGSVGEDSRAPIMELGSSREFTADRDGRLYLTANRGAFNDARGSFSVKILYAARNPNAGDNAVDSPWRRPGIRSRMPGTVTNEGRDLAREVTINVPATSRGTDTGIDVRAGEQIIFTASGTIIAGQRVGQVGPEGATSTGFGSVVNSRPVPTAGVGALIAYVRMANGQLSQPYLIGSQLSATVPADGRLILAINDDNYGDNSGSFSVRIRY